MMLSGEIAYGFEVRREEHLVPEWYEGPVVIVLDPRAATQVERKGDGVVVYRIPASGVLQLKSVERRSDVTAGFYVTRENGTRDVIPFHGSDETVRRVFDLIVGTRTDFIEGSKVQREYIAYVVGIPSRRSRYEWRKLRNQALEGALGAVDYQS